MALLPLMVRDSDAAQVQEAIRNAARRKGVKLKLPSTYSGEEPPPSSGSVFPVKLTKSSGTAGSSETQCSYKYYVQRHLEEDWWTGESWGDEDEKVEVDPLEGFWKRTDVGRYLTANSGYAHEKDTEDEDTHEVTHKLYLGWINEVWDVFSCT